jgi:hypothetical protein
VQACILDSLKFQSCSQKSGSTYRSATQKLSFLEEGGFDATGPENKLKTLSDVYVDVASRLAKNGILVVAGYPQLFSTSSDRYPATLGPGGSARACSLGNGLWILKDNALWINSLSVQGNKAIASQVALANSRLSTSRPDVQVVMAPYDVSFSGHRVCDNDSWINGLRVNPKDFIHLGFYYQTSFHPDRQGQSAIANWVKGYAEAAQWDQAHPVEKALAAGSESTLSAAGFAPGEQVIASLHSAPVVMGTYRANSAGVVTVPVHVPASFAPGAHTIVLTGMTSGRSQSFAVTVTRPAPAWRHYAIPAIAAMVALLAAWAAIRRRNGSRFA